MKKDEKNLEKRLNLFLVSSLFVVAFEQKIYCLNSEEMKKEQKVAIYSRYNRQALFVDGSDMMIRRDIVKLWKLRDDQYAIMVVNHLKFSKATHSFEGKSIQSYSMLNWSSVMLFNNSSLIPEYINTANYFNLY